jgi:hypothetical protein
MGAVFEHVYGPIGTCGQVFAAAMPDSAAVLYYVENVELIPHERRTVKLLEGIEGALLGFASWGLREQSEITTVTYDVYAQYPQSPDAANCSSPDEREALEVQEAAGDRARFKKELECLKRLVEDGESAAPLSSQGLGK